MINNRPPVTRLAGTGELMNWHWDGEI